MLKHEYLLFFLLSFLCLYLKHDKWQLLKSLFEAAGVRCLCKLSTVTNWNKKSKILYLIKEQLTYIEVETNQGRKDLFDHTSRPIVPSCHPSYHLQIFTVIYWHKYDDFVLFFSDFTTNYWILYVIKFLSIVLSYTCSD